MKDIFRNARGQALALPLFVGLSLLVTCRVGNAQTNGLGIPASEYSALVDLYNSTSGASWYYKSGWLNPQATSWYGVTVIVGHVVGLELGDNQLSGGIPTNLGNLTELNILDLGGNQLSGSIPTNLCNLSGLQVLDLDDNQLNGSIPTNQLNGSIPTNLGNLSQLRYLYLYENQLSGSVPTNLGNLSNLYDLDLDSNQLSGSIPDTLGNLSRLRYLLLFENHLSGSIPDNLGNLSQLQGLDLASNQLSGNVPDFTAFTGIYIDVSYNYLNIGVGSQSLANINAMIAAGNTVVYTPQTASPSLGPVFFLSGGTAQVGLTGLPGQYTIQASTDLMKWATLTNISLTGGSGQFLDASATNYSHRFYRAFIPP